MLREVRPQADKSDASINLAGSSWQPTLKSTRLPQAEKAAVEVSHVNKSMMQSHSCASYVVAVYDTSDVALADWVLC